jgi:hypothetical protein
MATRPTAVIIDLRLCKRSGQHLYSSRGQREGRQQEFSEDASGVSPSAGPRRIVLGQMYKKPRTTVRRPPRTKCPLLSATNK